MVRRHQSVYVIATLGAVASSACATQSSNESASFPPCVV
jgi:hypothetical protein